MEDVGGASDLVKMVKQESSGKKWSELTGNDVAKAVTRRHDDTTNAPTGGLAKVPGTVTIHPLWLAELRDNENWGIWTQTLFDSLEGENALEEYRKKAKNSIRPRPMDGLLKSSLAKTLFHEVSLSKILNNERLHFEPIAN
jgi:hypothetical protein